MSADAILERMRANAAVVAQHRDAQAHALAERDALWVEAREAGVAVRDICTIYGVTHGRVAQVTGARP